MSETKPHENPLINNKKLRQLYIAMVEARLLDEYIAGLRPKKKAGWLLDSTRGQEACRVSTAIELVDGDLVSDTQQGLVMDLVGGATVKSLLRRAAALTSGAKESTSKAAGRVSTVRQLPWVEDIGDRLRMAVGAALAFKTLKRPNIVVAYLRKGEIVDGIWFRLLGLASQFELPIIFVILPAASVKRGTGGRDVIGKAWSRGVPAIPVDASDAVALYRVAQESIGRARGDGGPVVIECVAHRLELGRKDGLDDPIVQLREFMLGRRVCSEAWIEGVGGAFRKRIEAHRG